MAELLNGLIHALGKDDNGVTGEPHILEVTESRRWDEQGRWPS